MLSAALSLLAVIGSTSSQLHRSPGCSGLQNAYDTFCLRGPHDSTGVTTQGRPGKQGAPGLKGDIGFRGADGERGPPAVIDYDEIEDIIQRRVQEGMVDVAFSLDND